MVAATARVAKVRMVALAPTGAMAGNRAAEGRVVPDRAAEDWVARDRVARDRAAEDWVARVVPAPEVVEEPLA
jgi:hypothetical protein